MGFLFSSSARAEKKFAKKQALPAEYLCKMGCNACPRNTDRLLKHPKMKPTGKLRPTIYILGEAPGETEDLKGRQFVGKAGRFFRDHLRQAGLLGKYKIRWNNTIRCRPPNNRTPEVNEIECCRGKQVRDIEKTKPWVVVVTGNIPLHWAIPGSGGEGGIMKWRGRWVAAKIGTHTCWVYPIIHPSAVIRQGGEEGGPYEVVFRTDLEALAKRLDSMSQRLRIVTVPKIEENHQAGVHNYLGNNEEDAEAIIDVLKTAARCDLVGVDIETQRVRPYWPDSRILSAAVSFKWPGPTVQETHSFPLYHPGGWSARLRERVWQAFVEFMHAPKPLKIAHNAKFEQEWLGYMISRGVVKTRWACTQAQAYILDSRQGMLDFDTQTRIYLGFWVKSLTPAMDKNRLAEYPLSQVLPYNAYDAKYLIPLYFRQQVDLAARPHHLELARERIETATTLVFAQLNGLLVDQKALADLIREFQLKRAEAEEMSKELPSFLKFHKLTKRWPNEDSKDDMQMLFTKFAPCPKLMTEKGKITTAEEKLLEVNPKRFPEAKVIIALREPEKILKTYLRTLESKITPDGRIHTNFNPFATDTERLSSDDPNVQNWPKRENRHVRKVIIAG